MAFKSAASTTNIAGPIAEPCIMLAVTSRSSEDSLCRECSVSDLAKDLESSYIRILGMGCRAGQSFGGERSDELYRTPC